MKQFLKSKTAEKIWTPNGKWSEVLATWLCHTLCYPMDYSLPGSSVHGTIQTKILEWVAISFARGSSQPRDQTRVFHIAGRLFTVWATRGICKWQMKVKVKVTQSGPTLCDPKDYTVHGNSPGQNTGVSSPSLLQGIFPTQGLNPGLPHCRQIFLPAGPQGKPKNTRVGSLSLLQRIFLPQESSRGLLHCRWILY